MVEERCLGNEHFGVARDPLKARLTCLSFLGYFLTNDMEKALFFLAIAPTSLLPVPLMLPF
jgi:hypothetical protein